MNHPRRRLPNRRVAPTAAVLGLLALALPFIAGAKDNAKPKPIIPKVQVAVFTDRSVMAYFEFIDDTGCILTDVTVAGALDSYTQDGSKTNIPAAMVSIDQTDGCRTTPLVLGLGVTNAPGALYIAPDLSYARVKLRITLADSMTFELFDADVDVVFKATGRVQVQNFHDVSTPDPKTTVVEDDHRASRPAIATGTVFAPGTSITPLSCNLIPDASFDGGISASIDTTVTITKP